MKRIKPFIKIILFTLVFSVVLYTLSYMAKPNDDASVYNIGHVAGFYAEKENSMDVVLIGGSAVFDYFSPLEAWNNYGMVSYDYATSKMQVELYKTIIQEILKTQSPKLIILDARAFQYRDKENIDYRPTGDIPYRNVLTGMHLSSNKTEFINKYVDKYAEENKQSYYFDIIKYHDNIVNFNLNNIKMMFDKYEDPWNGFYFISEVEEIKKYDFKTDAEKELSGDTEEIFTELLDFLDDIDVDVLFAVSPFSEQKEHKMTFNYIQRRVEDRGYKFIDCNESYEKMNLNFSTDFWNKDHVNLLGAEKYTNFLCDYISTNYDIPNRKEDPSFAFMNRNLTAWENEIIYAKAEISKSVEGRTNG